MARPRRWRRPRAMRSSASLNHALTIGTSVPARVSTTSPTSPRSSCISRTCTRPRAIGGSSRPDSQRRSGVCPRACCTSGPNSSARTTSSQVYGSTPRVTTSLSPQRLFNAPIYASANVEYAFLPDRAITDGVVVSDRSYSRLDVSPTVRVPLSRLTFLSVNTSAAYRTTHYSRSAALALDDSATVDEPYLRQYMTLRSEVVGPVFTRIWDLQGGFRRAAQARHRAGVHRRLHQPHRRTTTAHRW